MAAPILAIISGEPADIGPSIRLDLAFADPPCRPVVLCDKNLLAQRAEQLDRSVILRGFQAQAAKLLPKDEPEVLHIPLDVECRAGELNPVNAAYVPRLLDMVYQGISDGLFTGMVAVPLHGGTTNDAHAGNDPFSGHTEYLAEKSHAKQVVMILTDGDLRVALVTTYPPLKDISAVIMRPLIELVVRILEHDLHHKSSIARPVILVTGLSPYAGEGDHLGREEIDTIIPTLHALQAEGTDTHGPYPTDTAFQPFLLKGADVALAMYHDQGLLAFEYVGFGEDADIILGLSFIHTSVNHGMTLDLVGTGKADFGSLMTAVLAALDMAHNMQEQVI